ncbi:MAG: hypothetical protein CLLPBCKN_000941 [Chroococcidiopsis cubana SAG 39.79]|uniref:Uncharacterized protein n=1 Tax=Chroococcidiopsis cubana SAG 39.79 TaxID=388085 RepID=A0AB37UCH4_9CYAN|nr:hypothetical protein [Chroococcidiopsis cubana]MDZ4871553.1 hypothetical protein [Chroococcidiopsis cubana SAG 39.79]PSB61752.1 hypothetical protein C7B79_20765 [Chroococcidiopsis cubana CCALA 043]RUT05832.1 hypothetical protein DSM107010_54200 [Chroococcidiopsis cubana SAG 39.79]
MNKIVIALGIVLLSTTSAFAVELENRDSQPHKVTITEGENTEEIDLAAGASQTVCESTCQIDVEGIGSINATTPEDSFVIEEGKISVATVPNI